MCLYFSFTVSLENCRHLDLIFKKVRNMQYTFNCKQSPFLTVSVQQQHTLSIDISLTKLINICSIISINRLYPKKWSDSHFIQKYYQQFCQQTLLKKWSGSYFIHKNISTILSTYFINRCLTFVRWNEVCLVEDDNHGLAGDLTDHQTLRRLRLHSFNNVYHQ